MRIKFFIALTIVVVLSFSCQQELDVEPTVLPSPKILSIEPNPAKPGDVITITVENFSGPYKDCNWWIGSSQFCIDSVATSKLFTRVPWGIVGGILFYKTQTDTVAGPLLIITSRPPKILSVEPVFVKPGDIITITLEDFAEKYWSCDWWIGNERVCIVGATASKLFTRAPWGIRGGNLLYKTQTDTVVGPSIVITSPCSSNVCVSSYTGPAITESSTRDIPSQRIIKIANDTITIRLWYQPYPDAGGSVITRLRFKHLGTSILPLFLDVVGYNTPPQLIKGYIAIDRWSIPGVLSGHVLFYVTDWWDEYNFYCEVK